MSCAICFDDSLFQATGGTGLNERSADGPAALSCGHVFHKVCINSWFDETPRRNCPICRKVHDGPPLLLYIEAAQQNNGGSRNGRNNNRRANNNSRGNNNSSNSRSNNNSNNSRSNRNNSGTCSNCRNHETHMELEMISLMGQLSLMQDEVSDIRELEEQIGELYEEIANLNEKLATKDWELEETREQERDARVALLSQQILSEKHKNHIKGLQTAIERRNETIYDLEDQVEELESKLEECKGCSWCRYSRY